MYGNELQQTNFWAKLMTMPSKKENTNHPNNTTLKIGEVGSFFMSAAFVALRVVVLMKLTAIAWKILWILI